MSDLGQDIAQNPWALPSALGVGGGAALLSRGGKLGTPLGAALTGLGAYGLGYGERETAKTGQKKLADALKSIPANATYPKVAQTVVAGGGSLQDADDYWKQLQGPKTRRELVKEPGLPLGAYDPATNSYTPVAGGPTIPNRVSVTTRFYVPGTGWISVKPGENPPANALREPPRAVKPEKPRYTFQPDGKGGFVRINEDTLGTSAIPGIAKAPAKTDVKLPANLPKTHTWAPATSLPGAYYGAPNPGATVPGTGILHTPFGAAAARPLYYIPGKGFLNPGDPIPGTPYRWDGKP